MILFITILILLLMSRKKGVTMMTLLCGLYLISLVAAFLLSPSEFFLPDFSLLNYLYLFLFYPLLFIPWVGCSLKSPVELYCDKKDLFVYRIIKIVGIICFIINISVFILLQSVVTDFSSFKNGDEGEIILSQLPLGARIIATIAQYSTLLILTLPYHFYYLRLGNNKEAIWSLIIASNFMLSGLVSFSRSRMVLFLIIYSFLFIYFKRSFIKGLSRKMKIVLLASVAVSVGVFFSITSNRFAGDNIGVSEKFMYHPDALIKNPVATSQLSYFSQWYNKSNVWMPIYDGYITHGSRTFPLAALVLSRAGLTPKFPDYLELKLEQQFGDDTGSFLGCATVYLYDYGYLFAIVLLLIYFSFLKKKLEAKRFDVIDYMIVIILLQIPCSGIFNTVMNDSYWHFELLLFFALKLLLPKRTYKKISAK